MVHQLISIDGYATSCDVCQYTLDNIRLVTKQPPTTTYKYVFISHLTALLYYTPSDSNEGVAVRACARLLQPASLCLKHGDLLTVHSRTASVQPGTHVTVHQEQLSDG